ncbi:MAG: hypothetical protein RLY35_1151 [Bacteroidota bacterium]|jgi:hypothetical protein
MSVAPLELSYLGRNYYCYYYSAPPEPAVHVNLKVEILI